MSNLFNANHFLIDQTSSRNFNTNTSHPLIQSSQEYIYYKKYVSIHSEDRDMLKYTNPGEFEIDMPEDIMNITSLRLYSWTFPSNYSTFTATNSNISMTFQINNPYNPNINNVTNLLVQKTFEFLFLYQNNDFSLIIEDGFYNPYQMVTELTNKFNQAVTDKLRNYFDEKAIDPSLTPDEQALYVEAKSLLLTAGGYTNFIIVYNNVSQKIWFGNICDGFILTNEKQALKNTLVDNLYCGARAQLPDFSNWGLPGNLGLKRCNQESISGTTITNIAQTTQYGNTIVPRFFYGDVSYGDNGYWLLPNSELSGSEVHWLEATYKINLMGPGYMYMELDGQNCVDETAPYNVSQFTLRTNETNGVVNASFAKIAIPTTPLSQWFDRESSPYKFYYPPAEKMRRLKIKMRYHNGEVVNFGVFNYSFVLEFTLQLPQILRNSSSVAYPTGITNTAVSKKTNLH
jgi:hypothetical protein